MKTFLPDSFSERYVRPSLYDEDTKLVLGISIMTLLAGSFTIQFLGFEYFSDDFLDLYSPGFWLHIINAMFMFFIVYLNKKVTGWDWSNLGLAKPDNIWRPLLVFFGCLAATLLVAFYIQPIFRTLSDPPDISHLMVLRQNFPLLVLAMVTVWITAAFLEELVFRAYLINTLDLLLGRNAWSTWGAILISSVIFGMMHAWQGLSGILTTTCLGIIFGIGFIYNGRRIWPLILLHGLIDTYTIITIYNM